MPIKKDNILIQQIHIFIILRGSGKQHAIFFEKIITVHFGMTPNLFSRFLIDETQTNNYLAHF